MASHIIHMEAHDDPDNQSPECSSCSQCSSESDCSQDAEARRAKVIKRGIDKDILAVLDTKFKIGYQTFSILNTVSRDFCKNGTKDPGYAVVQVVEQAIARQQLNLDKKRKLFRILEWEFKCLACKTRKRANEYENSSYILWGATEPPRPHLRSGPCISCKEEARMGKKGGIIAYTVKSP